jgi:hypothetical protein
LRILAKFTACLMAGASTFLTNLWQEARSYRVSLITLLVLMGLSFSTYLLLKRDLAIRLASEDGLYEYLTATCFLTLVVFMVRLFLRTRNYFFLALALVFLVGCGEEISWGQRIFGWRTPASIAQKNIQGETNLHNLDVFHPQDETGQSKSGLAKLVTVDFLYNLFWLGWCIIIPAILLFDWAPARLLTYIRMPIPHLSIGLIFLINFGVYITIRKLLHVSKDDLYYMKLREVFECVSAMIFVAIGFGLIKQSIAKQK